MSIPEHKWFLMSRNLSGEATAREKEQLAKLLEADPGLAQQYELLRQLWHPDNDTSQASSDKITRILQLSAVQESLQDQPASITPSTPPWKKRVLQLAAVLIGVTLSAWIIYSFVLNRDSNRPALVESKKGTKTRTILPDGSTVYLNAGSRIEYDPGFNKSIREVTLFGEAYFDVVKENNRPFIVHAGKVNIKVLGTSFNVKSYPGEGTIETTLIKGLVQVTRDDDKEQQPIYLRPNQKLMLPELAQAITTDPLEKKIKGQGKTFAISFLDSNLRENQHIETAWVYNRLEFRGDQFSELARKLERWYNISIRFEDERVKQLTFNGSIENETVEQAFEALRTAVPFNFNINNNEVEVSSY